MATTFSKVYESFFSKITDDMYMEYSKEQTESMQQDLLIEAIPFFEFPRVNIFDYDLDSKSFNCDLNVEEINIIATYMVVAWMGQQLASVDNVRMKYSGADFKFTSQANHMDKLLKIKDSYQQKGFHLQRLYKRRKIDKDGNIKSTFGQIVERI